MCDEQDGKANVRDGSQADLQRHIHLRPLLGVKQTSNVRFQGAVSGDRYSCFFDLTTWRDFVTAAGFFEVQCYYRPSGLPCHKQPWLATVWRKG